MSKSLLPELLEVLERYLDASASAWLAQPDGSRIPTLPATSDGKVNVRAITLAIGRPQSQEQHLFRRPELKAAIDAVAIEQGLKPIGARNQPEDLEKAVVARMRRTDMRSNELSKMVAEQASVIERQRRTMDSLREQIRLFEETGQVLRTATVRP
jgi:uncharacterized coiled-coil protein SlyX